MLNLRYGRHAVSRGFITPQRLQQVLAKQRALSDQGKKVSVRMILEKSKLLTPDQLDQIDRDLNIKVVKKKTSTIQKAAVQQRQAQPRAVTAENFFGDEALPDVSGTQNANPDATIYSPPPPDMQERIRQEREKAKAAVRQKHDQQSGGPGPSRQAQPPQRAQPQRAQPQPQFAPMEPEMEPEPFAQDAAPELERMDSSPKLQSLPAEFNGFGAPEDEGLPSLDAGNGFDQFGEAPQQGGFDNLAPAEQGFDQFGEAPQQGGDMYSGTGQLGAEPEPAGNWGEDAPASPFADAGEPGSIDQTLYSPPPPRQPSRAAPEPAPLAQSFDNFGEDEAPVSPAFGDDAAIPPGDELNATLYSPPPANYAPQMQPEPEAEMMAEAEPFADAAEGFGEPEPVAPPVPQLKQPPAPTISGRKLPPGKKTVDDFADSGAESAPALDDVPTVKPRGEPVHPLRRGVSSEIDALKATEPPPPVSSRKASSGRNVKAAAPVEASIDLPDDDEPVVVAAAKEPVKPLHEPKGKAKQPAKVASNTPTVTAEPPKKKSKARMLLLFVLLLLLVVAGLVVPVIPEAQEKVPELRQLRNNEHAQVIFDNVEKWANKVREQFNLPPWKTGKTPMKAPIGEIPLPIDGEKPADGEKPVDGAKPPEEKPPEKPPEEAKPDFEGQWKALYKPGATWVVHMNFGMEMWQKTEVISVDGTKARVRTSMKMKADEEFANPAESDVEYKAPAAAGEPDPKWKELAKGEETVAGHDCTWVEGEYDGKRMKNWTSKKYGAWLPVKSEMEAGKSDLIEFKEGQ